jgi:hypothetical protein
LDHERAQSSVHPSYFPYYSHNPPHQYPNKRSSSSHHHHHHNPTQSSHQISISTPLIAHSSRHPPQDYGTPYPQTYRPPPTSHYATIRGPTQNLYRTTPRMNHQNREMQVVPQSTGCKRAPSELPMSHSTHWNQSQHQPIQRDTQRTSHVRQKSAPAVHHIAAPPPATSRSSGREQMVKPLQAYRSGGIIPPNNSSWNHHFPSYQSVNAVGEAQSRRHRYYSGEGSSNASSGTNLSLCPNPPQRSYYTTIGGRVFHRTISFPQSQQDDPTISSKQAQLEVPYPHSVLI